MRDHKTLLQERVQAANAGRLKYIDTAQSGPPHQRVFAVEARLDGEEGELVLAAAEGSSKKEAQQRAAELALASWHPSGAEDLTKPRGER
jgi:ribonuclease-3